MFLQTEHKKFGLRTGFQTHTVADKNAIVELGEYHP